MAFQHEYQQEVKGSKTTRRTTTIPGAKFAPFFESFSCEQYVMQSL
jgi:hypothetical protein